MVELVGDGCGCAQIRKSEERHDGSDAASRPNVLVSSKSVAVYGSSIVAVVYLEDGEVVGRANAAIARAVGNNQACVCSAAARQTCLELEELVRAGCTESVASSES